MSNSSGMTAWFRLLHALWAVALAIPVAVGILISIDAVERWHPSQHSVAPSFGQTPGTLASQLDAAKAIANTFAVVAGFHLCIAILLTLHARWSARVAPYVMIVGATCAASPMVIRLAVPIEDPYTGAGSPMAVLINVGILGGIGLIFAVPALVLFAIWCSRVGRQGTSCAL